MAKKNLLKTEVKNKLMKQKDLSTTRTPPRRERNSILSILFKKLKKEDVI